MHQGSHLLNYSTVLVHSNLPFSSFVARGATSFSATPKLHLKYLVLKKEFQETVFSSYHSSGAESFEKGRARELLIVLLCPKVLDVQKLLQE